MDITKLKANAEKRKEAANVCRSVAKTLEQYGEKLCTIWRYQYFLIQSMESEMKQPWCYHYIHSYSYSWYNIAAEFKINQSPDSGVTWLELTMPDRFPRIRQRKTLCQHNLTEYNNNTSNMYFYLIVLCRWV